MNFKAIFTKGDKIRYTKNMGRYIVDGKPMADTVEIVTVVGFYKNKMKVVSEYGYGFTFLPEFDTRYGKLEKV